MTDKYTLQRWHEQFHTGQSRLPLLEYYSSFLTIKTQQHQNPSSFSNHNLIFFTTALPPPPPSVKQQRWPDTSQPSFQLQPFQQALSQIANPWKAGTGTSRCQLTHLSTINSSNTRASKHLTGGKYTRSLLNRINAWTQLTTCKCEQRCDTNPLSAREISHKMLIPAHTSTLQSHLFPTRHTHRSHSQCKIYEFLGTQEYSSLSVLCSWSTSETICHKEVIYCQNANLQSICLWGLSINSQKTVEVEA